MKWIPVILLVLAGCQSTTTNTIYLGRTDYFQHKVAWGMETTIKGNNKTIRGTFNVDNQDKTHILNEGLDAPIEKVLKAVVYGHYLIVVLDQAGDANHAIVLDANLDRVHMMEIIPAPKAVSIRGPIMKVLGHDAAGNKAETVVDLSFLNP